MNVKLDLNQAKYCMKVKLWEQFLMLGWVGVIYILDLLLRGLIQNRLYHLQGFFSCLWVVLTCMVCFLLNSQFTWFQYNKIDTLKMFGMSNLSIFLVNIYQSRYLYLLLTSLYGIINSCLPDVPIIALLILEFCIYWYIFIFIYYMKTWHYYRVKLGKTFYRLKKILFHVGLLALLLVVFLQEQLQVLLRVKILYVRSQILFEGIIEFLNHTAGILLLVIVMLGTEFLYLKFICHHALYGEEDQDVSLFTRRAFLRDSILRFKGNRLTQILKLNYLQYLRNWNCVNTKLFMGVIWLIAVMYCKSEAFCMGMGVIVISFVSALALYRLQSDLGNQRLYVSIGCTIRETYWNHCLSAVVYVNSLNVFIVLLGVMIGKFDIWSGSLLIIWMIYQVLFAVSMHFYFALIRNVDITSQFYEIFGCLIEVILSLTPISILFLLVFLRKIKKGVELGEDNGRRKYDSD